MAELLFEISYAVSRILSSISTGLIVLLLFGLVVCLGVAVVKPGCRRACRQFMSVGVGVLLALLAADYLADKAVNVFKDGAAPECQEKVIVPMPDTSLLSFSERLPLPVEVVRPYSLTIATEEFDEIWLAAHPLSLREEISGMYQRQTPLGKVLGYAGVGMGFLLIVALFYWLFSMFVFGDEGASLWGPGNERGKNAERNSEEGRHKYIDLGLPSGTKWADQQDGLLYSYDKAIAVFGSRLPLLANWKELVNECRWDWDDRRCGYEVTGPNGNSIFLPAAGALAPGGETNILNGASGHYWAADVHDLAEAEFLYFSREKITLRHTGKDYFFSVITIKR